MEAYTENEHARALDRLAADVQGAKGPTPGPWHMANAPYSRTRNHPAGWNVCGPLGTDGDGIGVVASAYSDDVYGMRAGANARLVAAAPDLAEVCGKMERDIGELNRLTRAIDLKYHPDARNLVAALTAVIRLAEIHADAARAALAKAGVA